LSDNSYYAGVNKVIYIIILLVILCSPIFYLINQQVEAYISDQYFREIRQAQLNDDLFTMLELYGYIKENKPDYGYYDEKMAEYLSSWHFNNQDSPYAFVAEAKLGALLSIPKPDSYIHFYTNSIINTALANNQESPYFSAAKGQILGLIDLSPEMPKHYRELANLHRKTGDNNEAIKYYRAAIEKTPSLESPFLYFTHAQAIKIELFMNYIGLGEAYLALGNYDLAEENFVLAQEHNPYFIYIYNKLARVYYERGDFDKAIWYNKKGYENDQNNYFWPLTIAYLYEEKGDVSQALEYAREAQEISRRQNLNNLRAGDLINRLNREN